MSNAMKIALMGTRGIPASYSGFETCVEQMGQRLVERGHTVTVYCRSHHIRYPENSYKGMDLIKLPTIKNKYLDTIVHSFVSSIHSLKERFDIALYFIAGNSPVCWIPRLVGTKTILNVDGLDWKREKWPWAAKKYIQFAEYLATFLPNCHLTDSRVVQAYYQNRFGKLPPYIPYGSEVEMDERTETLDSLGLQPRKYFLFVGRLVPENCAHHLVEAFHNVKSDFKCVIVGDAPYAEEYKQWLRSLASDDPRIIFPGYVFGKGYNELGTHAYAFVETSGVGGTHPALLESMAFGNCVVVNDTAENLETMGDTGFSYNGKIGADSLRPVLTEILSKNETVELCRSKAKARALTVYSWESVVDSYETLFYDLLKLPLPERLVKSNAFSAADS
jgi:glycosyltransferase involved in cell wall biosynthesis